MGHLGRKSFILKHVYDYSKLIPIKKNSNFFVIAIFSTNFPIFRKKRICPRENQIKEKFRNRDFHFKIRLWSFESIASQKNRFLSLPFFDLKYMRMVKNSWFDATNNENPCQEIHFDLKFETNELLLKNDFASMTHICFTAAGK